MKIFGYLFIALGIVILTTQIVTGQIHIGSGGKITIPYATDPVRYWRYFFLYPSLTGVLGVFMVLREKKPDLGESIVLIVIVGVINLIGYLAGMAY